MRPPLDAYGDNFPVAEGLFWNPRTPWRHGHVTPSPEASWWFRVGWWTVVAVLMGLLVLVAAHDGFSAEPLPSPGTSSGTLVVQFYEGALQYPDGAVSALLHEVRFHPESLRQLNARYGLVAVERVVNPTRPTRRLYRLVFATAAGLERTLMAYRHDPHVMSADVDPKNPSRAGGHYGVPLYTRDA